MGISPSLKSFGIAEASSSHFEVSNAWRMARVFRVLRTARMARLMLGK